MTSELFFALEGTDGTGKKTQFDLLTRRLKDAGHNLATFDFPQYSQPSAYYVERYLNGDFGTADEVGPWRASLFYALDRYEAAFTIKEQLKAGKIVLTNRYVASSMGHQGAKIRHVFERKRFFQWLDELEYDILGVPAPRLNIVLHVPAEQAYQLIEQKAKRKYARGKKRDIHEADIDHLRHSEQVYSELCKIFPDKFTLVECMNGDRLLPVNDIHELVWQRVSEELKKVIS